MSQRVTVSVLAAILLGTAAAFFLLSDDAGEGRTSTAADPAAAQSSAAKPRESAELATPSSAAQAPAGASAPKNAGRETAPEEPEGPVRAGAWSKEEERWIRGHVALPLDLPGDEHVRVLAFSSPQHQWALYGRDGVLSTDDPKPGLADGLVSMAPVTPDGAFAIPVSDEHDEVHLALHARYLFLAHTVAVEDDEPPTLEPVFGGRILGRLEPPAGWTAETAALAGAGVELGIDELDTMFNSGAGLAQIQDIGQSFAERHTEARPDGTFELRAVTARDGLVLDVAPERLAKARVGDIVVRPGQTLEVSVPLSVGATLRGRVVDGAGAGVAGAEVKVALTRKAFGMVIPADQLRETESAADGTFELVGVTEGRIQVIAEADGYLEYMGESRTLTDGQVVEGLRLEMSRGLTLRGVVLLPDGEPAEGAEIELARDFGDFMSGDLSGMGDFRGMERDGETDEEGRFAISALTDKGYTLSVGYEDKYRASLTGVHAGGDPLTIVLEPPALFEGLVLDEGAKPVEDFTVRASLKASSPFMPSRERERESFETEDGRFSWDGLNAGQWDVYVTADGYSASEVQTVEIPRAEGPVEFVLPGTALARGRVLTPEGEPAAGATVGLYLEMAEQIASQIGQRDYAEAETEEDGSFELELPPGDRSIYATHPVWADSSPVVLSLESGDEEAGVALTLLEGATITGLVYDRSGEPAAGAQIIVQQPTGRGQRFAQSDSKGEFLLQHVNPGQAQVIAMLSDDDEGQDLTDGLDIASMMQNMKMAMVELEDGETEHIVLGAPPENPVQLRGRVTSAGSGLPEVLVSFIPEDSAGSGGSMNSLKFAQTDDDGRFEFQLETPGDYMINVQRLFGFGGQQQTVEFRRDIPEKDVYELELEMPEGAIRGRVYSPDGEPMAKARVSLTRADGMAFGTLLGGQYADIVTDESGNYELSFLRPGTYSVGAGGSLLGGMFGEAAPHGRQLRSGIVVAEGKVVEGVDFRLQASGAIHGKVRDELGNPVGAATIFLRDANGNLLELISTVTSDGSGRFRYPGVGQGEYTVTARTAKHAPLASQRVTVESGKTAEVTLDVTQGTLLLISLSDRSGEEVQSRITVTDPEGNEYNGMMSMETMMSLMQAGFSSTEQRVGPLAPGTYTVTATAEDGRSAKKSVDLTGQEERKVKLRLRD